VTVALTDSQTGVEQSSTTNDLGVYLFSKLRPGQGYALKFSLPGFKTANVTGLHLGVGTTHTVNQRLDLGEDSDVVVVQATGEGPGRGGSGGGRGSPPSTPGRRRSDTSAPPAASRTCRSRFAPARRASSACSRVSWPIPAAAVTATARSPARAPTRGTSRS